MPYYPAWKIPDGYRGRLFCREQKSGVDIARSWLYVPKRLSSVKRILHEASFVISVVLRSIGSGSNERPDVLIVITPPLALGLAAFLLSRKWRIPFIQHVADLQPDAAVDLGMLSSGGLTRALYAIERLSYKKASIISTLTVSMRDKILTKGVPPEKVVLSPDWARPDLFSIPWGESNEH
jgi:colanic acid biosynthesis glycosyl transferase WcaI